MNFRERNHYALRHSEQQLAAKSPRSVTKSMANLYVPQNDKFEGYMQFPRPRLVYLPTAPQSTEKFPKMPITSRMKLETRQGTGIVTEEDKTSEVPLSRQIQSLRQLASLK